MPRGMGITPAYAGRICISVLFRSNVEDHPRIRGKNLIFLLVINMQEGSPPHTREEWCDKEIIWRLLGITPAYAGRINILAGIYMLKEDHPRIRGKNEGFNVGDSILPGSPPHTREEFNSYRFRRSLRRITPAYAGRIIGIKLLTLK